MFPVILFCRSREEEDDDDDFLASLVKVHNTRSNCKKFLKFKSQTYFHTLLEIDIFVPFFINDRSRMKTSQKKKYVLSFKTKIIMGQ